MFDVEAQCAAWSIAQPHGSKLAGVRPYPLLAHAEHPRDRGRVDIPEERLSANEVGHPAGKDLEILRMQAEAGDLLMA